MREIRRQKRTLTAAEQLKMRQARAEIEADKDDILAKGQVSRRRAVARREEGIGARLKQLRTVAGLSQQSVADQAAKTADAMDLGLTAGALQAALSRIESGATRDPGALTLRALAGGLGVALGEIIGGEAAR